MSRPDWIVLLLTLLGMIAYGLYKGRTSRDLDGYFLSNRTAPSNGFPRPNRRQSTWTQQGMRRSPGPYVIQYGTQAILATRLTSP